jgi:hypothetical protein
MAVFPVRERGGRNFLGNTNTMEVHHVRNEQRNCQINEILQAGHEVGFDPDAHDEARRKGFDNCAYCLKAPDKTDV